MCVCVCVPLFLNWYISLLVSQSSEEEEKVYRQLLVDSQVFLAREIERKLTLNESH